MAYMNEWVGGWERGQHVLVGGGDEALDGLFCFLKGTIEGQSVQPPGDDFTCVL